MGSLHKKSPLFFTHLLHWFEKLDPWVAYIMFLTSIRCTPIEYNNILICQTSTFTWMSVDLGYFRRFAGDAALNLKTCYWVGSTTKPRTWITVKKLSNENRSLKCLDTMSLFLQVLYYRWNLPISTTPDMFLIVLPPFLISNTTYSSTYIKGTMRGCGSKAGAAASWVKGGRW